MSEAIQTSIYRLRQSIAAMDETTRRLHLVTLDIRYLEKEFLLKGYHVQKVKANIDSKHDYILFYKNWPIKIKWKEFIAEVAEENEDILKNNVAINEGFILLVKNKKHKQNLYAVTGGFGHIELQSFIDYQFGSDILSRLIKTEDKVLRTAKERGFIGGVLGSVKYFRGDYNLNENESFGNYYQELKAKLDKNVLKKVFKFKDEEIKKGGLVDAKSSFTIRKPLNIKRLTEIIDILHSVIQDDPIVDLNLIKRLDKSDKALIEKLNKEAYVQLLRIYKGLGSEVNFELCHKYFDKFFGADEYHVSFSDKILQTANIDECENFMSIRQLYSNATALGKDKKDFEKLIENTRISSFYDGVELTNGYLVDHLCAEISFNGRSYFLFNQEWFWLKPEFETILNSQCQDLMNTSIIKNVLKKWRARAEDENEFNGRHIGELNTLVFDKVTPQNIEACDILKWNTKEIYFIHVKKGFNNEMRNLGRQVHIAAKRIQEDLTTGKKYLDELYDTLANMKANEPYFLAAQKQLVSFPKAKFLKLFDGRKPIFIVAVLDESNTGNRDFSDMQKYKSNIAKFCLQQLRIEMRVMAMEFKIVEIEQ